MGKLAILALLAAPMWAQYFPPGGGGSSGVSSVTATVPIVSSGGSNPNITANLATSSTVGVMKPDKLSLHSSLPSQTGLSGAYLTTNGTSASWGTITTGPSGALDCVTIPYTWAAMALTTGDNVQYGPLSGR